MHSTQKGLEPKKTTNQKIKDADDTKQLNQTQEQPVSDCVTLFLPRAFWLTLDVQDVLALYREFNPVACHFHTNKIGLRIGSGEIVVPKAMAEKCVERWQYEYWRAVVLVPFHRVDSSEQFFDLVISGIPKHASVANLEISLRTDFECKCHHIFFDEARQFTGSVRTTIPRQFAEKLLSDPVYRLNGISHDIDVYRVAH